MDGNLFFIHNMWCPQTTTLIIRWKTGAGDCLPRKWATVIDIDDEYIPFTNQKSKILTGFVEILAKVSFYNK